MHEMPVVILACKVFQSLLEPRLRGLAVPATFLEYGLHRYPQQLAPALQAALDGLVAPSTVLIGYGLCGNGLVGLKARQHTLVVPRADDCITLLLGSYRRYRNEFSAEPGTYYLTRGWLESGSNPLKEFHELLDKYDRETAEWIMDEQYRNYRRLVLVAPDEGELRACRARAQEVAAFCAARWGWRYEERIGSSEYVEQLLARARGAPQADEDFLVIPPGGEVRAEQFWREV